MTLASELTKVQYNGDGSTTAFTVSFVFYENDGLRVLLLDSDGVENLQVLDTDYTLSGGSGSTGTLTMTTAPASGETLTIKSDIDDTQDTSLPLGGALASTAIELRLDILTRLVQQKEEDFSRTIKLNETTAFSTPTVEDPVTGQFLRWKADNTIESATITDTTGLSFSVDVTDTDTTKNKLVSNLLANAWENIKDVITAVASTTPVNTLQVTSADTGSPILLGAIGTDSNIDINITPKGTGATVLTTGDLTLTSGDINITAGSIIENKGADIASATSIDLSAATGNYIHITGNTGPIAALGTVAAGAEFTLVFDSTPTVTHNGTSLIMLNAASRTMEAGDMMVVRSEGSGNWRVVNIISNDGVSITTSSGAIVQIVNTQTGSVATGTTVMPEDDTIPKITEGTEFMTLAITPTSTSSILEISIIFQGSHNGVTDGLITVALFQDTTVNALAAIAAPRALVVGASALGVFTHRMTAGTISSTTFRIRAGAASVGTTTFNGSASARLYGGIMASSITIKEIQA